MDCKRIYNIKNLNIGILLSALLLIACSKEYNVEQYIGDYTFTTAGELHAYTVETTEGIMHPTDDRETFLVTPVNGEAKIFKAIGEPSNNLRILVSYDNGEVTQIDAIVNKANGIKLLPFSRDVTLYNENAQNAVYDGRLCFEGEGGIIDGVLTVDLCPKTTFNIDGKEFGYFSSKIRVFAE